MRTNNHFGDLEDAGKPIAFVLGGSAVGGLGVIRNLAKMGIPTVALDSDRKQVFIYSKYCKKFICPDAKNNEEDYIDFLLSLGEQLNEKGVLIPTGDVETLAILKHRDKLEKYYKFPMAQLEVAEKFLNKHIFYKLLEKLDIPHAKTYFPNDISTLEHISEKVTYPCIVKPAYSAYFTSDFQTKLFTANSKEELIQCCNKADEKNHEILVQEIIPGEESKEYGFNTYYDHNFNPVGIFTYQTIRGRPHMFGINCSIQQASLPELEEIVTSIVKKIKYYGIVDAEFKKDPRDNSFKLIEVNARAWMQIDLPTRCGINIPYIAYMDTIGENIEKPVLAEDGVKWFNMFEDLDSAIESIMKGRLSFHDWINSYRGKKEYAVFKWDDPIPFLVSVAKAIFHLFPYFLNQGSS